ncbi:hypothetical protein MRX96_035553 [Rhipicephalus microplus]
MASCAAGGGLAVLDAFSRKVACLKSAAAAADQWPSPEADPNGGPTRQRAAADIRGSLEHRRSPAKPVCLLVIAMRRLYSPLLAPSARTFPRCHSRQPWRAAVRVAAAAASRLGSRHESRSHSRNGTPAERLASRLWATVGTATVRPATAGGGPPSTSRPCRAHVVDVLDLASGLAWPLPRAPTGDRRPDDVPRSRSVDGRRCWPLSAVDGVWRASCCDSCCDAATMWWCEAAGGRDLTPPSGCRSAVLKGGAPWGFQLQDRTPGGLPAVVVSQVSQSIASPMAFAIP